MAAGDGDGCHHRRLIQRTGTVLADAAPPMPGSLVPAEKSGNGSNKGAFARQWLNCIADAAALVLLVSNILIDFVPWSGGLPPLVLDSLMREVVNLVSERWRYQRAFRMGIPLKECAYCRYVRLNRPASHNVFLSSLPIACLVLRLQAKENSLPIYKRLCGAPCPGVCSDSLYR